MFAYLSGQVLYSDGTTIILQTEGGLGFQIFFPELLPQRGSISLFITHIFREDGQVLYGFRTLKRKKFFELLLTVKGIGPKSSYSLLQNVGEDQIIQAIKFDQKKILQKANGIGSKAAAQIVLDLKDKVKDLLSWEHDFYKNELEGRQGFFADASHSSISPSEVEQDQSGKAFREKNEIFDNALQACLELGFDEERIIPLMQSILKRAEVNSPEQLVQIFLKEI